MTSLTDANGQTTSYSYDSINRPSTITRPTGGGSTSYAYGDTPGSLYVRTQTSIDSTRVVETYQYFDGLGRACRSLLNEGSTYLTSDTQYDSMGRSWRVSNSYRTTSLTASVNPDGYWTTNAYDDLGRVTSVTTPDNAAVTSAYSGSTSSPKGTVVTVTDQAGRARKSVTDALGRLATVYEDPGSSNYSTSYSYDTLDALTEVSQGSSQTRTFLYDSLKRLTSAANPESGTISYSYDDNGNLQTKTDARGVVATYAYDALNRNTSVTHTNDPASTPAISRYYDGFRGEVNNNVPNSKGRLWQTETSGSAGSRTTVNGFDAPGRPTSQSQQFYASSAWSQSFTVQRTYNLAGLVLTQTNPSGNAVAYVYDTAGRATTFSGNLGDGVQRSYSTEISYSPLGGMAQEKFGTDTSIYNKLYYNSRGQLSEIRDTTSDAGSSDTTWNRGKFVNWYSLQCGTVNSVDCNASENNGNLRKQETLIPNNDQNTSATSWYQQYDYDSLNRLQRVHEYTGNTSTD